MLSKAKYKLCKRLGGALFEKCQTQKYALSEARARKSKGRKRQMSDYGRQLIEKQKVRFAYGITEKQLRKYVHESMKAQDTVSTLNQKLEMRLDNVVYKLGFAPTRRAARQMVNHGHITVNGRKLNIPSHILKVGDVVAVREGSKARTLFSQLMETISKHKTEEWLNLDAKKLSGEVKALPSFEADKSIFDFVSVFEFYSR